MRVSASLQSSTRLLTYVNEECSGPGVDKVYTWSFSIDENVATAATAATGGDCRSYYPEQLYGDSFSTALDSEFDCPEVKKRML